MARLQVSDIDQWIVRLRKGGVGEASIRNQLQTLRSALAQAVRWGWISQNPASLASYERPKRTVRDVMSADDVQKVLAVAADVNEMAPVALRLAAMGPKGRRDRFPFEGVVRVEPPHVETIARPIVVGARREVGEPGHVRQLGKRWRRRRTSVPALGGSVCAPATAPSN